MFQKVYLQIFRQRGLMPSGFDDHCPSPPKTIAYLI